MTESETHDPTTNPSPAESASEANAADARAQPEAENPEIAAAKAEAAANYDRLMRAMADLENFRRRSVREKDELRLFATSRVLEDLLPVR